MQQITVMIAALPESAAGITGQPGNSTAHMRSIARMARKAFGTGPGERQFDVVTAWSVVPAPPRRPGLNYPGIASDLDASPAAAVQPKSDHKRQ